MAAYTCESIQTPRCEFDGSLTRDAAGTYVVKPFSIAFARIPMLELIQPVLDGSHLVVRHMTTTAFRYDFACGLGWHYVSRCDNACGAILVSGEPNIGTLVS